MNIAASRSQKLILLSAFLIGAAAGASIIYGLSYEFFSARPILAEFDKKFQEKIKAGSLPLSFAPESSGVPLKITFFSGTVQEIYPASQSLLLKVKNIYQGGDIGEFALNQPDFYEVKILTDAKTKIIDNVGFSEIKKYQNVNIVLREAIELPKTSVVKADFMQVPDARGVFKLETRLDAKLGDDASKYEKFLIFDALFKTSRAFVGVGAGSGSTGDFYGYGGLFAPSVDCLAGGGRPMDSSGPGPAPCDCSNSSNRWACFNKALEMSSWGRAKVAPGYTIVAWGWEKHESGDYSFRSVKFQEGDMLELTYSAYFMDEAERGDGERFYFSYNPSYSPPYGQNPGFSFFDIYRRIDSISSSPASLNASCPVPGAAGYGFPGWSTS